MSVTEKASKWFVSKVLLNASTTLKSRMLGIRENNPDTFWVKKDVVNIVENAFGKDLFLPEYSRDKLIFDDDIDYFGLISKCKFWDVLENVYLEQFYKKKKNIEINKTIEMYVKQNMLFCFRLLWSAYINKVRSLVKDIVKLSLNLSPINRAADDIHRKYLFLVSKYFKSRKFGLILGINLSYQYNYLLPIFESFNKRGISTLYVRGGSSNRLEKKDWGYIWNIKFPWILEILGKLKNRTYSSYRYDKDKLLKRIMSSDIDFVYKQYIIKYLDRELHRYYIYKSFLDNIIKKLTPSFVFIMPEIGPLQRTLLMLVRKREIPSVTYIPHLNMGKGIVQWFYLTDWLLVANKNLADLLQEKGFPKDRTSVVGSTFVDSSSKGESPERKIKREIDILLLTKPAYKTVSNDPVIATVIDTVENSKISCRIFIKPHPSDNDLYKRFTNKPSPKVLLIKPGSPLRDCVHDKDIIISCGISGAISECLVSLKPVVVVDISKNVDKSYLYRKDIREIVPLFENLGDFKIHMKKVLDDIAANNNKPYKIPQSLIDDLYYKLDGRASDRICEFVLSRLE